MVECKYCGGLSFADKSYENSDGEEITILTCGNCGEKEEIKLKY